MMENKHTLFTTTVGEKETMDKVRKGCKDQVRWKIYRQKYQDSLKCNINEVQEYPIQLEFELNGTCNYKCKSCTYRLDKNSGRRPEITYEKYCEIVEGAAKKGCYSIRYNYHNEPLIKKDISKYIKFAKEHGIVDTYFSTNGSLLDKKMSKCLIEAGLDRLQISLDAYTEDTYNTLRPGGNFEKVKSNVIRFMKIRDEMNTALPAVRVNFVKQKENIDELQEFCEYWTEEGVDSIGIQDFSEWYMEHNDEEYKGVEFHCDMPFNRLVIRYNGDVLPCCLFFSEKLVLGNIYDEGISLEELWNSSLINELRKYHSSSYGWYENLVCRKCVESLVSISE